MKNFISIIRLSLFLFITFSSAAPAIDRLGVYELLGRSGIGDLADWEPLFFEPDVGFVFRSRTANEEVILGWNDLSICRLASVGKVYNYLSVAENAKEMISTTKSASSTLSSCQGNFYFGEQLAIVLFSGRSIRGNRGVIAWAEVVTNVLDVFPENLEEALDHLAKTGTKPIEIFAINANRVAFRTEAGMRLLAIPGSVEEDETDTGRVVSSFFLEVCSFEVIRDSGVYSAGPFHSLGPEIDAGWQLVALQENIDPAAYWICGRKE